MDDLSSILVCTDDSGRYSGAVAEATKRAVDTGARVILYDVTAAGRLTSPRPNEWAGEGEQDVYDHPLDPVAIEKLGRHDFALQVQRAREAGADAYGWLPDAAGGAAIADYAAREHADVVLVPSALAEEQIVLDLRDATSKGSTVTVDVI